MYCEKSCLNKCCTFHLKRERTFDVYQTKVAVTAGMLPDHLNFLICQTSELHGYPQFICSTAILDQSRLEYNSNLGTETYNITLMFVDGERVAAPIDNTINYIMIVVSILILLSACFLALVLKCKE